MTLGMIVLGVVIVGVLFLLTKPERLPQEGKRGGKSGVMSLSKEKRAAGKREDASPRQGYIPDNYEQSEQYRKDLRRAAEDVKLMISNYVKSKQKKKR